MMRRKIDERERPRLPPNTQVRSGGSGLATGAGQGAADYFVGMRAGVELIRKHGMEKAEEIIATLDPPPPGEPLEQRLRSVASR